jgi:hypothetical protein
MPQIMLATAIPDVFVFGNGPATLIALDAKTALFAEDGIGGVCGGISFD